MVEGGPRAARSPGRPPSLLPPPQDDAVSVCPFYFSRADLAPSRFVPPWWSALPPPPAKLRAVCDLGYRDAARWLHAAGRLPTELTPEQVGSPPRWWTVARTPPRAAARSVR